MIVSESIISLLAVARLIQKYGIPAVEEALGVKEPVEITVRQLEEIIFNMKKPEDFFNE